MEGRREAVRWREGRRDGGQAQRNERNERKEEDTDT